MSNSLDSNQAHRLFGPDMGILYKLLAQVGKELELFTRETARSVFKNTAQTQAAVVADH